MKKTWKKCCSLIVAAGMVFALAACSSGTAAPAADTEKETEAPADVSAVDSVEDSDDARSNPGRETKIQSIKQERYCNKSDTSEGPPQRHL